MSPPPAQPTPPEHRVPEWAHGLFVLAVLLTFGAVVYSPPHFMVDDAWFYLQIGRNLALGLGSTFDGETPTDGYHPLWQGFVAGLALFSTDRSVLFGLALTAQVIFAGGAMAWVYRAASTHGVPFPILAPVALLLTQYSDKGWLSEGPLTALLLAAVLTTRGPQAGVWLGLLFLCRLDTVFFAAALLLFRRDRIALGTAAAVVALPWVVGHAVLWGHLVPVSGAIKSTFPVPDLSSPVAKIGWTGILSGLGSIAALALARVRPQRAWLLGALGLGGATHALYTTLFTGPLWSTFVPYYWIVGSLATALAMGELLVVYLAYLPSLGTQARRTLIGGGIVFLAGMASSRAVRSAIGDPDPTIELARWIEAELPNSRILVLDAPGRIAWFSGRPVVAMDGLTRDHGFSERVEGNLAAVVEELKISHLLLYDVSIELPWASVHADGPIVEVTLRAPKSRVEAGKLQIERATALKRLTDFVPNDSNAASLYAR